MRDNIRQYVDFLPTDTDEQKEIADGLYELVTRQENADVFYVIGFSRNELVRYERDFYNPVSDTCDIVSVVCSINFWSTAIVTQAATKYTCMEQAKEHLSEIKKSKARIFFTNTYSSIENNVNPRTLNDLKIYKVYISEPEEVDID